MPPESSLFGDSGYTNYKIEDRFREAEQVDLQISRKSNSKRKGYSTRYFIGLFLLGYEDAIEKDINNYPAEFYLDWLDIFCTGSVYPK